VVESGFSNVDNAAASLLGSGEHLYACTDNYATGTEVWRSPDGVNWSQLITGGLGDSNSGSVGAGAVFGGRLFLGTRNRANGGEIWTMVHEVYLPQVLRNH
jgi:hypothetical protein